MTIDEVYRAIPISKKTTLKNENNDERRQMGKIRSPDEGGNREIHPGKACHGVDVPRREREDMYYRVAPICFDEHDGDRYLLALTEDDRVLIFAIEYITGVSETEAMTTFSLPENLDIERFKKRCFDINKVV